MAETPTFQIWARKQISRDDLLKVEVERELWPDRTRVEVFEDGEWVEQ
jgi:hypothetical protein